MTLLFTNNTYILLIKNNDDIPVIINFNNLFPKLSNIYPLCISSNGGNTHIILDTLGFLHIIYSNTNGGDTYFSSYITQINIISNIIYTNCTIRNYINKYVPYHYKVNFVHPYDNDDYTSVGDIKIMFFDANNNILHVKTISVIAKYHHLNYNIIMNENFHVINTQDKLIENVNIIINLHNYNILGIKSKDTHYIDSDLLYTDWLEKCDPVKLYDNIMSKQILNQEIFVGKNINIKYISPLFPGDIYLIIDFYDNTIIYNFKNNTYIKIENIYFPYNICNVWKFVIIVTIKNCYIVEYGLNEILCTKINYPFNISISDNMSFNNFIWTPKTHKFLHHTIKDNIKTFILCNKSMGYFKIPYWLLHNILIIIAN